MPQGCGPAVGMPAATNAVLATWKTSTRDSDGFVRYRVLSLPLKIASAMLPQAGSGTVIPATTITVSMNALIARPGPPRPCTGATPGRGAAPAGISVDVFV